MEDENRTRKSPRKTAGKQKYVHFWTESGESEEEEDREPHNRSQNISKENNRDGTRRNDSSLVSEFTGVGSGSDGGAKEKKKSEGPPCEKSSNCNQLNGHRGRCNSKNTGGGATGVVSAQNGGGGATGVVSAQNLEAHYCSILQAYEERHLKQTKEMISLMQQILQRREQQEEQQEQEQVAQQEEQQVAQQVEKLEQKHLEMREQARQDRKLCMLMWEFLQWQKEEEEERLEMEQEKLQKQQQEQVQGEEEELQEEGQQQQQQQGQKQQQEKVQKTKRKEMDEVETGLKALSTDDECSGSRHKKGKLSEMVATIDDAVQTIVLKGLIKKSFEEFGVTLNEEEFEKAFEHAIGVCESRDIVKVISALMEHSDEFIDQIQ